MNPSEEELVELLTTLEDSVDLGEFDVRTLVGNLRDANRSEPSCTTWEYEVMAFSFYEDGPVDSGHPWGTHFGPFMVHPGEDGGMLEYPSLHQVDDAMLEYWARRAQTTRNPLLRARYAGLVWDLGNALNIGKPDHRFARMWCEAILELATSGIHKHKETPVRRFEKALDLALRLGDRSLIDKVKLAIFEQEQAVPVDAPAGFWGNSFDLLISNRYVSLLEAEERSIIDTLEKRMETLAHVDPWQCEFAGERLARYYGTRRRLDDSERVIRFMGKTFEGFAAAADTPMIAFAQLQRAYSLYSGCGLNAEADRTAVSLAEAGEKVADGMSEMSITVTVANQEMDELLEPLLNGDLRRILRNIGSYFVPHRADIEQQVRGLAEVAPLTFLLRKHVSDHKGRVVAEVGSLEDDLDGNLVRQMAQNIAISGIFLEEALRRTFTRFGVTSERLAQHIYESPVVPTAFRTLVQRGLQAFFDNDHITAMHILVPQLEAAIRHVVRLAGGATLRRRQGGGYSEMLLDELLRTEQVKTVFDEDIARYFRVLLTDPRGANLRNDLCHGMLPPDRFTEQTSNLIIHLWLVLACVEERSP